MVINKGFRTPRLVFTFLDTQHKLLYSLPGQTELNSAQTEGSFSLSTMRSSFQIIILAAMKIGRQVEKFETKLFNNRDLFD